MITYEQLQMLRATGHVQRCHTTPHHGSYSLAEHCWHVMHLIMSLHPNPSLALLKAAAYHDSPEMITGDIPAPAKADWPNLNQAVKEAEASVLDLIGIPELFHDLGVEDFLWLQLLDRLELYLWCLDQISLGNAHAEDMAERIRKGLEAQPVIPDQIKKFMLHDLQFVV